MAAPADTLRFVSNEILQTPVNPVSILVPGTSHNIQDPTVLHLDGNHRQQMSWLTKEGAKNPDNPLRSDYIFLIDVDDEMIQGGINSTDNDLETQRRSLYLGLTSMAMNARGQLDTKAPIALSTQARVFEEAKNGRLVMAVSDQQIEGTDDHIISCTFLQGDKIVAETKGTVRLKIPENQVKGLKLPNFEYEGETIVLGNIKASKDRARDYVSISLDTNPAHNDAGRAEGENYWQDTIFERIFKKNEVIMQGAWTAETGIGFAMRSNELADHRLFGIYDVKYIRPVIAGDNESNEGTELEYRIRKINKNTSPAERMQGLIDEEPLLSHTDVVLYELQAYDTNGKLVKTSVLAAAPKIA